MLTINETANKEILKAKRALHKAIEILANTAEFQHEFSIFHACTVRDVERMVAAMKHLND